MVWCAFPTSSGRGEPGRLDCHQKWDGMAIEKSLNHHMAQETEKKILPISALRYRQFLHWLLGPPQPTSLRLDRPMMAIQVIWKESYVCIRSFRRWFFYNARQVAIVYICRYVYIWHLPTGDAVTRWRGKNLGSLKPEKLAMENQPFSHSVRWFFHRLPVGYGWL
jgi:hypothetical protein